MAKTEQLYLNVAIQVAEETVGNADGCHCFEGQFLRNQ